LLACNNTTTEKKEATPEVDHQHSEVTTLKLNNGVKWKTDESTNKNVAELEAIANRFHNDTTKQVADFTAFANEMQTGLDKMIRECRMQGADHEALHQWLEPLLNNVGALKKAVDKKEGPKLFEEIRERLQNFHQYFE